jgi:hypothetical protein
MAYTNVYHLWKDHDHADWERRASNLMQRKIKIKIYLGFC